MSHCNMCTLSVDGLFFPVCLFSLLLDFHKQTIALLRQPSFLGRTDAIFIMLKIYVCMFAHVHTQHEDIHSLCAHYYYHRLSDVVPYAFDAVNSPSEV